MKYRYFSNISLEPESKEKYLSQIHKSQLEISLSTWYSYRVAIHTPSPTHILCCQSGFYKRQFAKLWINLSAQKAATLHLFNTSYKKSETDIFLDSFLSTSIRTNVIPLNTVCVQFLSSFFFKSHIFQNILQEVFWGHFLCRWI